MSVLYVSKYTEFPGLRHCSISDFSGEDYYHNILNEAFFLATQNKEILTINLDNTAGFAPSFLDETFGNLIYDFGIDLVQKNIKLISEDEPYLINLIKNETFIQWEERRKKNITPKKTEDHKSWHRYDNNKYIMVKNQ